MLIPVGNTRQQPGSSYRVVSPLRSHHHFNGRPRPGSGQPAAVWLARKRLYNPWDSLAEGLGQLSMEKAKEIMMYGPTRGFTDEQMRAASQVVYPAQTSTGLLVSAARIASGEFEVEQAPAAGERAVATTTAAAVAIPPKPTQERPPLYLIEACTPLDVACVARNAARFNANNAILKNASQDYDRAVCERNCALNTRAGHPERCHDCAGDFPRVSVPPAPGSRSTGAQRAPTETSRDPAVTPDAPVKPPPGADQPAPEGVAVNMIEPGQDGRLAAIEERARGAAATAASFLTASMVGGIPNWLLIAGVAATGLVLLGKQR